MNLFFVFFIAIPKYLPHWLSSLSTSSSSSDCVIFSVLLLSRGSDSSMPSMSKNNSSSGRPFDRSSCLSGAEWTTLFIYNKSKQPAKKIVLVVLRIGRCVQELLTCLTLFTSWCTNENGVCVLNVGLFPMLIGVLSGVTGGVRSDNSFELSVVLAVNVISLTSFIASPALLFDASPYIVLRENDRQTRNNRIEM